VSTGEPNTQQQLAFLASMLGQLDFFCINDTTDDAHQHDPRLEKVREAMGEMFPHPSGFERVLQAHDACK
jgi:hypothetical protein